MKFLLKFILLVITICWSCNTLFAETYPTKNYKWQKIGEFNTRLTDTSNYVYSKILKSSNNFFVLGGRSYGPSYYRSILLSKDFGKTWENIFPKGSLNTDCIIDSQDRLLIIGNGKDSANFIHTRDLNSDITNTITIITKDKNYSFTRIWELDTNNYLIKGSDGNIDYIFKFNINDSGLVQLLPRKGLIDSNDIAIDRDLKVITNISFGIDQNRITVTSFGGRLYYSDDLFKTIKFGFDESDSFNGFTQIQINNGQFLYSTAKYEDTVAKYPISISLFRIIENAPEKDLILKNYLYAKQYMDPISMMACSNEKYIVCRMGVSMLNWAFGDSLNVDSLMISDDFGESFKYVSFPKVDSLYNYFAYASPSITKTGEIFLVVPLKTNKGQPSPVLSEVFYGKPDDVSVQENISSIGSISPNPASDYINVGISNYTLKGVVDKKEIRIFDIFGKPALNVGAIHELPLRIDISTLPAGVYFVRTGEKVEKFMKLQ